MILENRDLSEKDCETDVEDEAVCPKKKNEEIQVIEVEKEDEVKVSEQVAVSQLLEDLPTGDSLNEVPKQEPIPNKSEAPDVDIQTLEEFFNSLQKRQKKLWVKSNEASILILTNIFKYLFIFVFFILFN